MSRNEKSWYICATSVFMTLVLPFLFKFVALKHKKFLLKISKRNSNTKQLDKSSKLYRALREFFWLSTYNWPSIKLTNRQTIAIWRFVAWLLLLKNQAYCARCQRNRWSEGNFFLSGCDRIRKLLQAIYL